ncbi:MAG: triose-phosphate isomerase [Bacillota bacterium]|nr:MAG: triose-phosphate isomerase [Bacillota bacterium]
MHGLRSRSSALVADLAKELERLGATGGPVDVVVCPPYTALCDVGRELQRTRGIDLGAQNLHWEDKGAFTGEISGPMLVEVGCRYVIVGHSERRQFFGETDESVSRRLGAALRHGLQPILCVGETWEEREGGRTEEVLTTQLRGALAGADGGPAGLSVAYEPVWAIGTGRAAQGRDAQAAAVLIRTLLAEKFGPKEAAGVRILYGGSVKPDNIGEFATQFDVDGALVGGASLDPGAFAEIVRQVMG